MQEEIRRFWQMLRTFLFGLSHPTSPLFSCVPAFLIHCFEFFISLSENKRQPPFRRANDRRRSANEPSRRILV